MLPPYGGPRSGCRLRRIKYTFAGYVTLDKSLTFFVLQLHLHNDSFVRGKDTEQYLYVPVGREGVCVCVPTSVYWDQVR